MRKKCTVGVRVENKQGNNADKKAYSRCLIHKCKIKSDAQKLIMLLFHLQLNIIFSYLKNNFYFYFSAIDIDKD